MTKETIKFFYNGKSMHPTFREGQLLYVSPVLGDLIPGDVLVYKVVERQIVHRVLSVKKTGFITRGDNNRLEDAELVMPDQVLGRVEMVGDEKGIHPVLGGRCGLWRARLRWACKFFEQPVRLVFGWPYRFLKAKGWVAHIWKPEFQVMSLGQGEARIVKYLFHDQTVAVWDAKLNRFTCRKPFDLVLRAPHA
jgi:hypothetical protein